MKVYILFFGVEIILIIVVNFGGGYDVFFFNIFEGGVGIIGLFLYGIW